MRAFVRRGWFVLLVWAFNLFVLWVVAWAIFDPGTETVAMLGAAWAVTAGLAAWALVRERRAGTPADVAPSASVDASPSTALAGIALVALALSAEMGPWLTYLSGGALLVAAGGLARERRAARAAVATARECEEGPG